MARAICVFEILDASIFARGNGKGRRFSSTGHGAIDVDHRGGHINIVAGKYGTTSVYRISGAGFVSGASQPRLINRAPECVGVMALGITTHMVKAIRRQREIASGLDVDCFGIQCAGNNHTTNRFKVNNSAQIKN